MGLMLVYKVWFCHIYLNNSMLVNYMQHVQARSSSSNQWHDKNQSNYAYSSIPSYSNSACRVLRSLIISDVYKTVMNCPDTFSPLLKQLNHGKIHIHITSHELSSNYLLGVTAQVCIYLYYCHHWFNKLGFILNNLLYNLLSFLPLRFRNSLSWLLNMRYLTVTYDIAWIWHIFIGI